MDFCPSVLLAMTSKGLFLMGFQQRTWTLNLRNVFDHEIEFDASKALKGQNIYLAFGFGGSGGGRRLNIWRFVA